MSGGEASHTALSVTENCIIAGKGQELGERHANLKGLHECLRYMAANARRQISDKTEFFQARTYREIARLDKTIFSPHVAVSFEYGNTCQKGTIVCTGISYPGSPAQISLKAAARPWSRSPEICTVGKHLIKVLSVLFFSGRQHGV